MAKEFSVFKVVKKIVGGRLVSVFSSIPPEEDIFTIEYYPQVSVTPKIGMIFAFDSLGSVQEEWSLDFDDARGSEQLWHCETTKKPVPCNILVPIRSTDQKLITFWKKYPSFSKGGETQMHGMATPEGTVLCEDIKLLERVE